MSENIDTGTRATARPRHRHLGQRPDERDCGKRKAHGLHGHVPAASECCGSGRCAAVHEAPRAWHRGGHTHDERGMHAPLKALVHHREPTRIGGDMARRPPTRLAYTPLRWVQIAGVRERQSPLGICLRRRPRHDVPCCCLTPLDPALPLVLVLCIVDLLSLRCAGKKIGPVIAIIITEPSWSSPHLIITIYYHHHHHRYHQQHCHPSPSSSRPSSLSAPFTPTLPPSSTASSLTTVVHDHHHRHRHRHHVFAIVAVIPCIITAIVVIVTVTLAILAQARLLAPRRVRSTTFVVQLR